MTNTYRLAYLRDAQAAPDGGFPTVTTEIAATAPTNTLRQDLKTNDLRNWTPTAPVLLCAADQDPTAFYLNTQLMQSYWMANPPAAAVTVLDVDSAVMAGDPYADSEKWICCGESPDRGRGCALRGDRWRHDRCSRGVSCATRPACLPQCGKIVFRRIPMRVKWQLSLTSC